MYSNNAFGAIGNVRFMGNDDDGNALTLSSVNRSITSWEVCVSSAPVGSSAKTMAGRLTSARAIETANNVRFIVEAMEVQIASYKAQLEQADLDEDRAADLTNDVMFLEAGCWGGSVPTYLCK